MHVESISRPYFPTSMVSPNILGGAIDGVDLPNDFHSSPRVCLLLMLWTAPATGIVMCQIAAAVVRRRESAYGYEQT